MYFPHVDNVYSHRSTQKYKRKPFVSHYWDCRMKGRPPGTPKSDDPAKKKRKRNARERDLCDVKIKITEYFPGATLQADEDPNLTGPQSITFPVSIPQRPQQFGADGFQDPPGANGERFWTIQRVNGNGANGKADGVAGPHKHTLERSDEIKKSTVQRYLAAQEKEAKKLQVSHQLLTSVPR
jgi:glutathione S-transferase